MEQIQGVYKDLHFDGLWIDMNEPSNYCTGDVCWNSGEHLSNAVKEPVFHARTISMLCHGAVISQSLGILPTHSWTHSWTQFGPIPGPIPEICI